MEKTTLSDEVRWGLAFLLALGVWGLLQPVAAWACGGTIICVDGDAPGPAHDGASWTTAYTTLQHALDYTNANSGTDYEIWVAEGVYYPDEGGAHVDNSESLPLATTTSSSTAASVAMVSVRLCARSAIGPPIPPSSAAICSRMTRTPTAWLSTPMTSPVLTPTTFST
jgi:hypothetical protein